MKKRASPIAPEDGAKQQPHSDGIKESGAVVLRHPPVGRKVFGKHSLELHWERLGVHRVEFDCLAAFFGTAELVQQLIILPAVQ